MGWFQHDRADMAVPVDNGHGHNPRALSVFRFQTTAWHKNTGTQITSQRRQE